MTHVSSNKFQIITYSCCSNLKIRIWKDCSCFFKISLDFAKDFRRVRVIRKDRDSWENALLYIG